MAAASFRLAEPDAGDVISVPARPASLVGTTMESASDIARPDRAARPAPGGSISAEDIDRALAADSRGDRDLVVDRMLSAWVDDDPQGAARYAELQTDTFLREVALRSVAQGWARMNADAAVEWAESLTDGAERDRVIGQVALVIAESDPPRALDALAHRGAGPSMDSARTGVISSWASRDFAAAQAWVEAQPPGNARDDIVQHLVFQRAQTDPRAATQLAGELIGAQAARRDSYVSILRPWLERDPAAARAWMATADAETGRLLDAELATVSRGAPPD